MYSLTRGYEPGARQTARTFDRSPYLLMVTIFPVGVLIFLMRCPPAMCRAVNEARRIDI